MQLFESLQSLSLAIESLELDLGLAWKVLSIGLKMYVLVNV